MKKIVLCVLGICGSLLFGDIFVSPGVDTLVTAVAAAPPGSVLVLQSGVGGDYEVTQTVVIDKPLTIKGDGINPILPHVFTTVPLVALIDLHSSDITLQDFELDDQGGSMQTIFTVFTFPFLSHTNINISGIHFKYHNIALAIRNSEVDISNNFFETQDPANVDHTAIFFSGLFQNTLVSHNTFTANSSGSTGTTFIEATDQQGFPFSGPFTIENNTLIPGGTAETDALNQFFVMEGFGNSGIISVSLTLQENEFTANNGSFYFNSDVNLPADRFSSVSVVGNQDHSVLPNDYKGLVAFTGTGSGWQVGTDPFSIFSFSGNQLATTAVTAPGWVAILPGGLFGIDSAVYDPPVVPPVQDLQGSQYIERFASQGDLVNFLTWISVDITTESFNIYKNSPTNLIANIPARPGRNQFIDGGQKPGRTTTYFVSAIVGGAESTKIPITIP